MLARSVLPRDQQRTRVDNHFRGKALPFISNEVARELKIPTKDACKEFTRNDATQYLNVRQLAVGGSSWKCKSGAARNNPSSTRTRWTCENDGCEGKWELEVPKGSAMGTSIDSSHCTCLQDITYDPSTWPDWCETWQACQQKILRHYLGEQQVGILEIKSTTPIGFEKPPARRATKRSSNGEPKITKTKEVYLKLPDNTWFAVKCQKKAGNYWSPRGDPPDAIMIAKPLEPVDTQSDAGREDDRNKPAAKDHPEEEDLCVLCLEEPSTCCLVCPRCGPNNTSNRLCEDCLFEGTSRRPKNDHLVVFNPGGMIAKCYSCRNDIVTKYRSLKGNSEHRPIHFPIGYLGELPIDHMTDFVRYAYAFDHVVLPIWECRAALHGLLATTNYHTDDPRRSQKIKLIEEKLRKIRFPDWAVDWKRNTPVPFENDEKFTPEERIEYIKKFDLGNLPDRCTDPSVLFPITEEKGPVEEWARDIASDTDKMLSTTKDDYLEYCGKAVAYTLRARSHDSQRDQEWLEEHRELYSPSQLQHEFERRLVIGHLEESQEQANQEPGVDSFDSSEVIDISNDDSDYSPGSA